MIFLADPARPVITVRRAGRLWEQREAVNAVMNCRITCRPSVGPR